MTAADLEWWCSPAGATSPHIDFADPGHGRGLQYRAHCGRCGQVGAVRVFGQYATAALDRDRHGCEATQT
jgi:hypothetical protein